MSERSPNIPQPRDEDEGHGPKARSAARLAAVQALYQSELAQTDVRRVAQEFVQHRLGREIEDVEYRLADVDFFKDLVEGVATHQNEIDGMANERLAAGWRLSRLDSILRAVLRAGVYELTHRRDVPVRVVIGEYVDVAHAFFEGQEPGVVNGVLDKIAHQVRGDELDRRRAR
jgi:N utilization substance protein B